MTYNDLSINKYLSIQEYIKIDNLIQSKVKIFQELTGQPLEAIDALPATEFFKQYNKATEFMLEDLPSEWSKVIEIKGQTFYPALSFKEWTAGQFMSFQSLSKEGIDAMAMVMAIMLRKDKREVLNEAQMVERAEWLGNNMSIAQAYPLYLFFSTLIIALPTAMLTSLEGVSKARQTISKLRGVGILCWRALRNGITPDFRQYWKLMFWRS